MLATAAKESFKSNENVWIAGVKIVADGSPHCGTSAIRVPPYMKTKVTEILGSRVLQTMVH